MKRIAGIVMIFLIFAAAVDAGARKRRTTRGDINRRSVPARTVDALPDTFIIPAEGEIRIYGYDKPLRSRRESMFISNLTGHDISSMTVTTEYYDSSDRLFHQMTRRVAADIPAGATRRVEYPSWDTQQSFYYTGSKRSRSSGTPYNVRQSVDTIFVNMCK